MNKKVTVKTIQKIKDSGEKFSVLTAYDFSTAKYIDEAVGTVCALAAQ